jgi:2,3-diketo-5-methylthio-1-phosphopentane phosphatase
MSHSSENPVTIDQNLPDGDARLFSLHIFCDFDGTISALDIGDDFFRTFSRQEPWHSRLLAGELSIRDYWRTVAEGIDRPLDETALDEYIGGIPIDPGAHELLELARIENIPFTVVSDGFDFYIRRFLAVHGIDGAEVFCNRSVLTDDGRLALGFPHAAEGCECMSAACKRNIVLRSVAPDARVVYIGDGRSDFCPAEHADVIFAKKHLAAYCNANRLPHYPFKTLADVARQLRLLLDRRRLRPRHQAQLRRKSAWEAE